MASFRKLPSGQWQGSVVLPVKLPSGRPKRDYMTHPLKGTVQRWALDLEARIAAGTWMETQSADLTLRAWREEWESGRLAAGATTSKNASQWRVHIEPVWGGHPLAMITRPGLKRWVAKMHGRLCRHCHADPGLTRGGALVRHQTNAGRVCKGSGERPGLSAWTIQGAVAHLSGLLAAAVEDGYLPANPAAQLKLPRVDPKPIFYWTHAEADLIVAKLAGGDQLAVDTNMHIGLRPGELLGLRRRFVDVDRWLIHVAGVQTRSGWRDHPKSKKSRRAVPIPPHLRGRWTAHLAGMGPDDVVFTGPGGGCWDDRNWAQRVFGPAVKAAGVRRGTPHGMRHTAASWLVQAGVPLQKVQQLLGHEKYETTLRYAHLAPDAFDAVVSSWPLAEVIEIDPRRELGTS